MANTTNYKFNLPVVGGDQNNWGGYLNENWSKIDSLLYGASYTDTDSNTVEKIQPDLDEGNWAVNGTAVAATGAELNKLSGFNGTTAELNILAGATTTTAELNILAGATPTTAEVNTLDGDTAATATTLVDADRLIVNDDGTMVQVALSDVKTYLGDPSDAAITLTAGNALTGGGTINLNQTAASTVTFDHDDTSSQASVSNSGGAVVQSVTLDDYGHVTALTSATVPSSLTSNISTTTASFANNTLTTVSLGSSFAGAFYLLLFGASGQNLQFEVGNLDSNGSMQKSVSSSGGSTPGTLIGFK